MDNLLRKINRPGDLAGLTEDELGSLCGEIREKIVDVVSRNGGHLSSNLGVVELTCCLERVFGDPEDRIVFDVGHQCYTHKLLTGRREAFSTLRQKGGISGFPKPGESGSDAFIAGHSSTAISVALGLADAKRLKGESGSVVALVGDGAMTGGMFYEALNNVCESDAKVVIVINDNEMSISPNVGGIARHLAALTSRGSYFRFKDAAEKFLKGIPLAGNVLFSTASKCRDFFKRLLVRSNIFGNIGIKYIGPIDGHDIKQLLTVFERAKKLDHSVVVVCNTVKGKGFTPAESFPTEYHSTAPFIIENACGENDKKASFSSVFGEEAVRLAESDGRVCAVTASMKSGVGLCGFAERFPERFFDVGIAEQHAVTFSAALAAGGMLPLFAVYSSFLQRAFDQLVHDAAIGRYHAVFCVDRAGFVGEDGDTHNGLLDVSYLGCIPGFTVYSPSSFSELRLCLRSAAAGAGPTAVRYPRGGEGELCAELEPSDDSVLYGSGGKLLFVTYGRETENAAGAVELLHKRGVNADLLKLVRIIPLSDGAVSEALRYDTVVFAEEAVENGSVGDAMACRLMKKNYRGRFIHVCAHGFGGQDTVEGQLTACGLDADSLLRTALEATDAT